MKFLDYLFHGKELKAIGNYFKMLNGYSPTFTSFSGGVYEMDLTRTAINNFATHCSKLKPEIEGSALKSLEKTLQHKPNYFMDTTKFIKRLATYVAVEHTAFIIPIEDEYGRLCGWYPLRAERCEVVESEGQLYLRYLFANGSYGAIEFERVGIMTDFEYKSWTDAASQLGAFTSLENAKSACKAGYTVYDDNGKAVYTAAGQQASAGVPFSVQVDILDLNIRTGAGTNYAKTGETTGKGVFTIVEVKAGQGASAGWGRLKSGAGWISLDYATRLA